MGSRTGHSIGLVSRHRIRPLGAVAGVCRGRRLPVRAANTRAQCPRVAVAGGLQRRRKVDVAAADNGHGELSIRSGTARAPSVPRRYYPIADRGLSPGGRGGPVRRRLTPDLAAIQHLGRPGSGSFSNNGSGGFGAPASYLPAAAIGPRRGRTERGFEPDLAYVDGGASSSASELGNGAGGFT